MQKSSHGLWRFYSLVGLILGLTSLAGVLPAKTDERELQVALLREFEPLHPLLHRQRATDYMSGFVNRHLFSFNHNAELQPDLVSDLPIPAPFPELSSGEPRGGPINLRIRSEAFWGDGQAVTGYDVLFSWELARSLPLAADLQAILANITAVTVAPDDPKKFTLTLRQISRATLDGLAMVRILPKHIEESAFAQHSAKNDAYRRYSFYMLQPTQEGLYNGPFLVQEFLPGRRIVFVRNPSFYGPAPLVDRIEVRFFHHYGDLEVALAAGTLHLILPVGVDLDNLPLFESMIKRHKLAWQIAFYPSLAYEHIAVKQTHPILSDVRVRRALHYGINKERLLKQLFGDKYYLAHHFISPLDQWYPRDSSKVIFYPHREKKAQQLLSEAGWKSEKDGYRWRHGKKLQLPIVSNEEVPYRGALLEFLKDEWHKLGVDLVVKTEASAVFFPETIKKGKYTGLALLASEKPLHYIPRPLFHSSAIPQLKNGFNGENTSHWTNSRVDALLDSLSYEWEPTRCQDALEQLVRWYTQELPAIPLFYRSLAAIKSPALAGYHISGHATPETFRSEYWSLQDLP